MSCSQGISQKLQEQNLVVAGIKNQLQNTLNQTPNTTHYPEGLSETEKSSRISTRLESSRQPQSVIEQKNESEQKISIKMFLSSLFKEKSTVKTISYNEIKPLIRFQKYLNSLGFQRGKGTNGCLCFLPCKWKVIWTHNYQPNYQKLYHSLKQEKPTQKNSLQISKDINRTYPECPTYNQNKHFIKKLEEILLVYSVYDPQIGYVQGLNMIVAVLLYHIKQTEKTFWAFVDMMDDQQLRMIYYNNFEHLKKHCDTLKEILRENLQDLCDHMQEQIGITPDAFFYGWILSLMSNCIPLEYMHLVVDKFRALGWSFLYKLIITYLVYIKEKLLESTESCEFLMNVTKTASREVGVHWQQIIQNCYKVQL